MSRTPDRPAWIVAGSLALLSSMTADWLTQFAPHTAQRNDLLLLLVPIIVGSGITLYVLLMRAIDHSVTQGRLAHPAAFPRSWPNDTDPTVYLGTQPLSPWRVDDPNKTHPMDPQADIPTEIHNWGDDSRMLLPWEELNG